MREEYDFSHAQRGAVIDSTGKTQISIYLDNDIIEALRTQAEAEGRGYQSIINSILRNSLQVTDNSIVPKI
jgi:uncharacterized protein (DUF4415 family)